MIDDLVQLAVLNGCDDQASCDALLRNAALEQRSLVAAILDAKIVREPEFLIALADLLHLPWRDEDGVATIEHVRDKFPARLALGQIVIPEAMVEGESCACSLLIRSILRVFRLWRSFGKGQ